MSALPLIVFDVNETILDLETMEPTFERIFGDKSAMRLWFANLIMYSAALTVAGCYVPFTDIGAAVMKMLADTRGIKINDNDKKELTEKFSTMPPHPEVPAALRKLRAYAAAIVSKLRSVAPYAVIELVLPGGSLIALALWLYRRQKKIPNFYHSLDALL